ncbi:hypothetical protein K488DRAFT_89842 [Vararia minispora EC-137]|uniref:Uncharacterized protein n=1 Tax=Vararia minispora EC-137 TaxID=1314806 RepID=A0ACB8Q9C9_9AGAM|nr:hypothetical protein K488DRAFT_89842 [Vararia minispora EC-137]
MRTEAGGRKAAAVIGPEGGDAIKRPSSFPRPYATVTAPRHNSPPPTSSSLRRPRRVALSAPADATQASTRRRRLNRAPTRTGAFSSSASASSTLLTAFSRREKHMDSPSLNLPPASAPHPPRLDTSGAPPFSVPPASPSPGPPTAPPSTGPTSPADSTPAPSGPLMATAPVPDTGAPDAGAPSFHVPPRMRRYAAFSEADPAADAAASDSDLDAVGSPDEDAEQPLSPPPRAVPPTPAPAPSASAPASPASTPAPVPRRSAPPRASKKHAKAAAHRARPSAAPTAKRPFVPRIPRDPNDRSLDCTQCGRRFSRLTDRLRHVTTVHGAVGFVCQGTSCSNAGHAYSRLDAAVRHQRAAAACRDAEIRTVLISSLPQNQAPSVQDTAQQQQQQVPSATGPLDALAAAAASIAAAEAEPRQ